MPVSMTAMSLGMRSKLSVSVGSLVPSRLLHQYSRPVHTNDALLLAGMEALPNSKESFAAAFSQTMAEQRPAAL
jgi:hypothetical protein